MALYEVWYSTYQVLDSTYYIQVYAHRSSSTGITRYYVYKVQGTYR